MGRSPSKKDAPVLNSGWGDRGEGQMAGKDQMSVHTQEERVCLMTRLGLVTNVRNYKRRTGSYTDGCTKTDGRRQAQLPQ